MDSKGTHKEEKDELSKEEMCNKIVKLFEDNNGKGASSSRVVLVGEAGIGKTWLARQICSKLEAQGMDAVASSSPSPSPSPSPQPSSSSSSCYLSLWLHLNKKLDEISLYQDLAAQLSLFPAYEESDEDDADEGNTKAEKVKELKNKILEELNTKKKGPAKEDDTYDEREKKDDDDEEEKKQAEEEEEEKKYLLLILDDEGSVTHENKVLKDLKLREFLEGNGHRVKILMTRRENREEEDAPREEGDGEDVCVLGPLNEDESRALLEDSREFLESLTGDESRASLESLHEKKEIQDPALISCIMKKAKGLPAAIVTLAKSLSRAKRNGLSEEQKKVFKELILSSESSYEAAGSKSAMDPQKYNPVLYLAYELLKSDPALNPATVACFWHSLDFFQHCGSVYYRELIANWILEGYFDPVWSAEKAYRDGHDILMELIERGFLKIQEDNVVVPERSMSNLIDLQDCGFFRRSSLGFSRVHGGDKTKGLGKITHPDDMMKEVRFKKEKASTKVDPKAEVSTILVSGRHLRHETHNKFFEKPEMEGLQVLGLFNPTFESLVPSLSKLKNLRVLVIRDCDLLESIDELTKLKTLHVLEVSGASSLKSIRDDFFKAMKHLQSLNLSRLWIKSSPSTISQLTELRCLIMRDCPELEDLPDVQSLDKLEVIDVHGARELKTCFDKTKGKDKNKSKNKNFAHLQKLQHLDLSGSQIDRLPIFQDSTRKTISSLTRLLVRDCNKLRRLPMLKPLSSLQILDISGATSLQEMYEVCFENKDELRILNLSGTSLGELPDTISGLSKLSQFLLRDCLMLGALPHIETLTNLEVFDVSGCTKLDKIEGSFEHMSYLRELVLSGTKLKTLPKLPEQSSLCSSKHIVLPDSRCLKREDWGEIEACLKSSGWISETREILEKKSETGEKPKDVPRACICNEKKDERDELIPRADEYNSIYMKARNFNDAQFPQEIKEFHGSFSDDDKEKAAAEAEFFSFADNNSANLSSIFQAFKIQSAKGCWVERCKKMETLFANGDMKHTASLEVLWISNLPLLNSLCSEDLPQNGFENLKKLSLDCCPNIKTLFSPSQLPTKLEILRITFCDNLEKVFEHEGEHEGELPILKSIYLFELPKLWTIGAKFPNGVTLTAEKCPKLSATESLK